MVTFGSMSSNRRSPVSGSKRIRTAAGFSLIELLVVIGIMSILLKIGYPKITSLMMHYRLDGAARKLMADLQKTRFRAIAERMCFKVKFDSPVPTGWYQLQKGPATGACNSATYADEGSAQKVDSVNFLTVAATANPVFDTRGAVNTTANITLTTPVGSTRTISVETAGRIRIP